MQAGERFAFCQWQMDAQPIRKQIVSSSEPYPAFLTSFFAYAFLRGAGDGEDEDDESEIDIFEAISADDLDALQVGVVSSTLAGVPQLKR